MKVEFNIESLERKIASWHRKLEFSGNDVQDNYYAGRIDSYMEILCNFLGVTDSLKQTELEERIIEKYRKEQQ